ncbi:MAG: response regulator [Thermoanaerobaculia bacterium]
MPRSILLADDSVTIQKVIELTFMDEDFEVTSVSNGSAAIERLGEMHPDLVIADVHMPGASGYDVCRMVKRVYPSVPVMLLVGTFEAFDEAEARAAGADRDLKKPFDSHELLSTVRELLAISPPAEATPAPQVADPGISIGVDSFDWDALSRASEVPTEAMPATFDLDKAPSFGDLDLEPAPMAFDAPAPTFSVEPVGFGDLPLSMDTGLADDETLTRRPPPPEAETSRAFAFASGLEPSVTIEPPGLEAEAKADDLEDLAAPAGFAWPDFEAPRAEEPSTLEPEGQSYAYVEPEAPASLDETASPSAEDPDFDPIPTAPEPPPAPPVMAVAAPAAPIAAAPSGELSDADVDRIARRVVELLGEKIVRDVAWEVVPDLAELAIKDRLRELESQLGS